MWNLLEDVAVVASDLTILHLSDLQFGCHHRYKGKEPYQTLLDKLVADLEHLEEAYDVRANAIVVTGDVAQTSVPSEYEQARVFLDGLLAALKMERQRVVIVPGNHDVNWSLCQVVLHGHRHVADVEQTKRVKAKAPTTVVATGSAGLDAEALPDHPNQYQIVKITAERQLTLYMRQYSTQSFGLTGKGEWRADPAIEEDRGIVTCDLGIKEAGTRRQHAAPRMSMADAKRRFLGYLREEHRFLPLQGFGTKQQTAVELEPVFISLRAMPSHLEREMSREELAMGDGPTDMEIGPALRFCEQNERSGLVILGDPGSGKTTLLKYVALCLAQSRPAKESGIKPGRLPIFLPLREVKDFEGSLEEALRSFYPMARLKLPADFFERALDSGQCLVLLDGLDEVATPERREAAGQWIECERKLRPENPIAVTSRFAGYKGQARLPGNYLEVHVRDFSDDDVRTFVKQWYRQIEIKERGDSSHARERAAQLADDLIQHLSRVSAHRELAKNPLMLQIICLVHRSEGYMPRRRTELYNVCIEVLLEKWDKAKGLDILLDAAEARLVLRPLALWLHSEEGRTHADVEDVKKVLKPELARVKRQTREVEEHLERVLTSVRGRSGLLVGDDAERCGFQHLSFQEFLAAEEIAKQGLHERLVKAFGHSWWREPTLLALGLDAPRFQSAFFRELIRSKPFRDNLDFALSCIREALAPCIEPFAEAVSDAKLHGDVRHNCIMLLREIGGEEAVDALREAADARVPEVADAARDALVHLGVAVAAAVIAKDGTELIKIPAGEFIMGSNDHLANEHPQREVYLDEYCVGRHPVTNAQYRQFLEATQHDEPKYWHDKRYNKPNQPVVGVTWHDARAYCEWAGLRLPTEAEWEKAARGTDGRLWPWGSEPKPNEKLCNFDGNVGTTTEIGSYPEGASPYGCHDMAGNVHEWCYDNMGDYLKAGDRNPKGDTAGPVSRGGCMNSEENCVRCSIRCRHKSTHRFSQVGFRCAR